MIVVVGSAFAVKFILSIFLLFGRYLVLNYLKVSENLQSDQFFERFFSSS